MNANTFRTLEFDKIRALLLMQAGSALGKSHVETLVPHTEPAAVREALGFTTEAVALLQDLGRQPYHDLPDLQEILAGARVEGVHLSPPALLDVASFIEGGSDIARQVARTERTPRLAGLASEVKDLYELRDAIRRAILPPGEVADDASPKLAETRRALVRLKAQLTSVMDSFLHAKEADRILQDKVVTTRNDRYVLLLKTEHRRNIPGIIHGSSGSGASLFLEPLPAVELNNDIVSLQDEERREVIRILQALTARVGERAADLGRAAEVLGELDAAQAMALLARDMDASPPQVGEALELELLEARHPLLMPLLAERLGIDRRARGGPVPVTVRVGSKEPVLVVSGPNTGGKTVALKTVGLLALMAQSGLHIPASAGSRVPVFRRLYADIGDEQSIAANLSTFSAHLAAVVEMTRNLSAPSLVLLDEVGAGTDPTEGGALGVAIVDYFRSRGAMVVATTHHGLLKAYAQSTPGVTCASFGYDPATYAPTYRLALGAPGRSLALEMAERLGLPPEVVADARLRRDSKEAQAEAVLKRLEEGQAALAQEEARIAEARREVEAAREGQRAAERELKARQRAEVEAFVRGLRRKEQELAQRAGEAIAEAVARVEATRRSAEAEGARARGAVLRSIRAAQEEVLRDPGLGLAEEAEGPSSPLAVGTRVRVATLGVTGEVLSLHDGEAEVAVGGKRLRVKQADLRTLAGGPAGARPVPTAPERGRRRGEAAAEINLLGLTVDEALPRVDKLLDDAALSDRREIRVIHGFGEGRLRKAVAGLLQGHPHVAAWRVGNAGEGGGGVTIVELKE